MTASHGEKTAAARLVPSRLSRNGTTRGLHGIVEDGADVEKAVEEGFDESELVQVQLRPHSLQRR